MRAVVIFLSLAAHIILITMVGTYAILTFSFHGVPVEELVAANPWLTIFGILIAVAYAAFTAVMSSFKIYELLIDLFIP